MSGGMSTTFLAETMATRGYRVIRGDDATLTGGAADSRLVEPGQLFAAFRGEHHDGNDFIAEALARGATAVIGERMPAGAWPGRTLVAAGDTRRAAGEAAHAWRRHCGPLVVGITGTVGKTTAKELTAAALARHFRTHRSPGNLNSREGLPLALVSLAPDDDVSVLEIAMDSPGEIAELCAVAEPEVGVVLNIGATHVEKLGSIEAIAREKLSLARSLPETGTAVLNADDPRIAPVASELACRVITFGLSEGATLRATGVRSRGLAGSELDVTYGGATAHVTLRLPGDHVVPAALAAIGAQLALGVPLAAAAEAVSEARVDGRLRVHSTPAGVTILDDTYNASPASVAGALRLLAELDGRRVAFLGDMAELGDLAEGEHRRIGGLAPACCDLLIATGEQARNLADAAKAAGLEDARWFADKDAAAETLADELREGDVVLVKASRSQALETVIPLLGGSA